MFRVDSKTRRLEMWGRLRSNILAYLHAYRIPSRDITTTSDLQLAQSAQAYPSLPGMQPRHTSIAAAGGAQAVCFYDLTLGG
jgi:hypothetical protein